MGIRLEIEQNNSIAIASIRNDKGEIPDYSKIPRELKFLYASENEETSWIDHLKNALKKQNLKKAPEVFEILKENYNEIVPILGIYNYAEKALRYFDKKGNAPKWIQREVEQLHEKKVEWGTIYPKTLYKEAITKDALVLPEFMAPTEEIYLPIKKTKNKLRDTLKKSVSVFKLPDGFGAKAKINLEIPTEFGFDISIKGYNVYGKGKTEEDAINSCISEYLERAFSMFPLKKDAIKYIDTDDPKLVKSAMVLWLNEGKIPAVKGKLFNGEDAYFPASSVYVFYPSLSGNTGTNGLAAHPHLKNAIENGFFELLERESIMTQNIQYVTPLSKKNDFEMVLLTPFKLPTIYTKRSQLNDKNKYTIGMASDFSLEKAKEKSVRDLYLTERITSNENFKKIQTATLNGKTTLKKVINKVGVLPGWVELPNGVVRVLGYGLGSDPWTQYISPRQIAKKVEYKPL